MKEQIISATTFEGALREALALGFTTAETAIGTHQAIKDMLSEMEEDESEPEEYTRFGCYIVRITDAWKENAEIIALS